MKFLPTLFCAFLLTMSCDEEQQVPIVNEQFEYCQIKSHGDFLLAIVGPTEMYVDVTGIDDAALFAAKNINDFGGVHGRTIGIVTCDTKAEISLAKNIMLELSERDDVVGIIGPSWSSIVLETYDIAVNAQKIMISTSATSPALSHIDDNGYFFRVIRSDAQPITVSAKVAKEYGYEKAFVLAPNDAYGHDAAQYFVDNFNGSTIVHEYDSSDGSFADTAINKILESDADFIFFLNHAQKDDEILFKTARSYGVKIPWMHLSYNEAINSVGDFARWFFGISTLQTNQKALDKYRRISSGVLNDIEHESEQTLAFDAVYMIAAAMQMSDNPVDGEQVKNILVHNMSTGYRVYPGEFQYMYTSPPQIDYVGASGEINFDENGDINSMYQFWRWNGKVEYINDCWSMYGRIRCDI